MPKPTPTPLPPVRTFVDACFQAMALHEELGAPVQSALCLGRRGQQRDGIAVTGWPHSIDTVVGFAVARSGFDPGFRKLLLISTVEGGAKEIVEDDIRWFERLRTDLAEGTRPIELLDWLKVDGDDIRSLAITIDGEKSWDR